MDMVLPFLLGTLLCAVQLLLALPWLAVLDPEMFRKSLRQPSAWGGALAGVATGGVMLAVLFGIIQDEKTLMLWGRLFGAVLQVQLVIDLFVLAFGAMLLVWPKGGAVAQATFREGVSPRQPVFLVLVLAGMILMGLSLILPYFTFGEDLKMVRELGYDAIMLMAVLFGTLLASMTISEEIEGRTAITLMSKPVSRRQFLVGKFVGLLLAAGVLTFTLGWVFNWVVWLKPIYDAQAGDAPPPPEWIATGRQMLVGWLGAGNAPTVNFVLGSAQWLAEIVEMMPGLILGFCQVSVLLAFAVALATRVPMEVNLVTCAVVFILGHLSHILVLVSVERNQFIIVMAKIFDTLLPGLEMFNLGTLIARDIPPDPYAFGIYLVYVVGYAVMYTVIVLVFGLILFEDRDLA